MIIYLLIILLAYHGNIRDDEGRYVMFAKNLAQGFYSPKCEVNLWNGPGYPLVLVPFVMMKLNFLAARILNAFFLFFAVIYFYITLKMYLNPKYALYTSYLFGLYPVVLRDLHTLLTETFIYLLICGFIYHFCKLMRQEGNVKYHFIISSFFLGFLASTKIIFGYVILTVGALSLII